MKYPDGFFDQMKFPVEHLPVGTDLMKEFPMLQIREAFKVPYLFFDESEQDYDRNKLLRYVFYCYDQSIDWELVAPDIVDRKIAAFKLAGFQTKDNILTEQIVENVIVQVNDMIVEFLNMQNNRKFSQKILTLEVLTQYAQILMEQLDPRMDDDKRMKAILVKSKLLEDTATFGDKLDAMDIQFFGSTKEAAEIDIPEPISPQNLSSLENDE